MPKPRTRDPRDTRNAPPSRPPKEAATAIPPRAAAVPAPPVQPPKTYKVEWAAGAFLIVRISNGSADDYLIERLSPRLFRVRKLVPLGSEYVVEIAPLTSCPCKGYAHHGTCKHVEVLLSLCEKGRV